MMKTDHRVVSGDSRSLSEVATDSVELVVTSPPYPMIEMWDDLFENLNPTIGDCIEQNEGERAFSMMHDELNQVWEEVARVLTEGGIACINIGDATRKIDDDFRVFQNHSQITNRFAELGFDPLPEILWRKPTNTNAKFMGSGMLPPNAYVTLEHEYILIFRNGSKREFEARSNNRYSSSYFWEERNQWFSDMWMDIKGEHQSITDDEIRDRSAAYPFQIPYRLINMYSVYGDTVLDPFWGTGTTSLAAMVAGRDSVGYELDKNFITLFESRITDIEDFSKEIIARRLTNHRGFIEEKLKEDTEFKYESDHYGFPVTTKQEKPMQFYGISSVQQSGNTFEVTHTPISADGLEMDTIRPNGETTSISDFTGNRESNASTKKSSPHR